MTSKKTPDRKVAQGVTTGTIAGVIAAIFTAVFHKHLSPEWMTFLPMAIGVAGHFAGSYMAPYSPRIEEIIAYVKQILNDIPPVATA